MMPLIVASLLEKGLGLIGNAVLAKGQQVVEDKLGVKLGEGQISPELALQLKQAEYEHEEWLLEAEIRRAEQALTETKVFLTDVADARGMQGKALAQDDLFVRRFVYYFATVVFAFTALYIVCITFADIPEKSIRFADTVLGFLLGTMMATIMNFFFGTSKSSQSKDSTLDAMVKHISGKDAK